MTVDDVSGPFFGALLVGMLWIWGLEYADVFAEDRRHKHRWSRGRVGGRDVVDVTMIAGRLHSSARGAASVEMLLGATAVHGVLVTTATPWGIVEIGVALAVLAAYLGRRRRALRAVHSPRRAPTATAIAAGALSAILAAGAVAVFVRAMIFSVEYGRTSDQGDYNRSLLVALAGFGLLYLAGGQWRHALAMCRVRRAPDVGVDDRAPLLYLRSFADDRLTMRVSPFARSTLVERLSGQRLSTFEEILAEELVRYAPVIAVAEPGREARTSTVNHESLDEHTWRVQVRQRMEKAAAVIVVAGRGGGIDWEVEALVDSGAWRRTIFLFPLARPDELLRRWAHIDTALDRLGLRDALLPGEPPYLLAAVPTDDGCRFYTAGKLNAWGYKAAVVAGLAEITQRARPGDPRLAKAG